MSHVPEKRQTLLSSATLTYDFLKDAASKVSSPPINSTASINYTTETNELRRSSTQTKRGKSKMVKCSDLCK